MTICKALTIAGSDSGGGAGIQADLKTFQELDVFGMSAVTAVTAQNTLGVHGVYPLGAVALIAQLDAVGTDLQPDALKTGMLFDQSCIKAAADRIRHYRWRNVTADPVMMAKNGQPLLQPDAVRTMIELLFPLCTLITPNLPEAAALTGMKDICGMDRKREAARRLHAMGPTYVLLKGGHDESDPSVTDLLYDGEAFIEFSGTRISTRHTHGTGCTLSAAITAELAKGATVPAAVATGKAFVQAAIEDALHIGAGQGPTHHGAFRRRLQEGIVEQGVESIC
ncbi:bifunctional hydroxymethylpyrimidine kinase/phosphomethylpyrimidine kinase [Paenibacillus gansuensis]|uniref:Hydroxymethylpyrimidine/phosphomethylpyrimidine kinase n=1 Tax=Paenibacillus gansuensis TaxID=306542 RepID=A0ABW5P7A3_9BACL